MTQIKLHGHACLEIKTDNCNILIDPFINGNPLSDITVDDVKPDIILVTHAHGDHLGDTIDIAKKNNSLVIACHEIAVYCQKFDVNAYGMNVGGTYYDNKRNLKIKLTPAIHSSSFPDGSYGGIACGFLITTPTLSIYHAGDTALFKEMEYLRGKVDIACLPIGDTYVMGIDEFVEAVKLITPKYVIPMHYNTFPVIKQDINIVLDKLNELNTKVVIKEPTGVFNI